MKSLGEKIRKSILRVLTFAMVLAISTSATNLVITSASTLVPPMKEASNFSSMVVEEKK